MWDQKDVAIVAQAFKAVAPHDVAKAAALLLAVAEECGIPNRYIEAAIHSYVRRGYDE